MTVAIVIPSIGIDPLLERCVSECRRTAPEAELLVYVDDATGRERLGDGVVVVETGPISIAAKRNLGVASTGAEFVAFIDSDAYPDDGWVQAAVAVLGSPEWSAVGGPNVSPPVESRSERHVGFAHNSFLVAGWWTYRRRRGAAAREVGALPSCNLVVRRADYLAVSGMNELLFTAEDTDFCRRLVTSGRRIRFSPAVMVFHKNRHLRSFVVQRYTFGVAMVPLLQRGAAPELRYTLASGVMGSFVVFLLSAPLGRWSPTWARLWRVVVGAYLGIVAVEAVRQSEDVTDLPGTAVALLVGNLAPGVGIVAKALGVSPELGGVYRNDR